MSRGIPTFRKSDVTRAIKAVRAAGADVARIEIDSGGKIVIVTGSPTEEPISDFERWKAKHARAAEGA